MPSKPALPDAPRGDQIPVCERCGERHVTRYGTQACGGHRSHNHPQPGTPCAQPPLRGATVCVTHGGNAKQVKAAAARRETERKARVALAKLGGEGEPVTDPVATLCAIAGRAVKLMQDFGDRVAELALPQDGISGDGAHVEIRAYQIAIKEAAGVVESIIRMGIAERFAKQNAEAVAAYVACLDAIVTDLGHNPRDPEVAGVITRRLELIA